MVKRTKRRKTNRRYKKRRVNRSRRTKRKTMKRRRLKGGSADKALAFATTMLPGNTGPSSVATPNDVVGMIVEEYSEGVGSTKPWKFHNYDYSICPEPGRLASKSRNTPLLISGLLDPPHANGYQGHSIMSLRETPPGWGRHPKPALTYVQFGASSSNGYRYAEIKVTRTEGGDEAEEGSEEAEENTASRLSGVFIGILPSDVVLHVPIRQGDSQMMVNGFGRGIGSAAAPPNRPTEPRPLTEPLDATNASTYPFEFTYGDVVGMLWVKGEGSQLARRGSRPTPRPDRLVLFNVSKMVDHTIIRGRIYPRDWRLPLYTARKDALTWAWATKNQGDIATLNIADTDADADDNYAARVAKYILV